MAFTVACPNFKKDLKMVLGPLGVKVHDLDFERIAFGGYGFRR
jgi:hypothetical protein